MSAAADPHRFRPAPAEPEGEVELWWGGYSGWTMVPDFAVCTFLTAVMIGVACYLYSEENVPGYRARYIVYGLAFAIWFMQVYRWARRTAVLNYRLTTRRLFHCRGLGVERVSAIALPDVVRVGVVQTHVQRHIGVGLVRVETAKETIDLAGVREPHRVAALIERQVKHLQQTDQVP
jgi:hypothetical protein